MKKCLKLCICLLLSVSLVACGNKEDKDILKVGLLQLMDHTSLNIIKDAILNEFNQQGYIDGENLESYKVEIVGINYLQSNKNIRIKITDEKLIKETGGIVQGMSGTPVMQNGKLIGAINCVNVNNPQDAYAIFIDKII